MDFIAYQREEDNYRFVRATCGLVGFIVFFLGAFIAFIVAGEMELRYYGLTLILGFSMLAITALFFCCILHETKRVKILTDPSAATELTPFVRQPEPVLPAEPQPEQQEAGWPSGDSDETVDLENDPDPDLQALLKMAKSGSTAGAKEVLAEICKDSQAKDSTNSEGELTDFESDPTKAGPSKVADRRSEVIESRSEISALKGQINLSKSDSAIVDSASVEKQTENVSVALRKLSLDASKKAKTSKQDPSSTKRAETSKDAKSVKSTKAE